MDWGRTWAPLGLCLVGLGPGISRGRALGEFHVFKDISSALLLGTSGRRGADGGHRGREQGVPVSYLSGTVLFCYKYSISS